MKFILGKKIEMTQIFKDDGTVIPVTAVLATPNVVTQVKQQDGKDKYNAIQIGFNPAKKLKKSLAGQLKDLALVRTLKEFSARADEIAGLKRGDEITVKVFVPGDIVKVSGVSKGKGFQGVVKRHHFHGSPKTHGHKDQNRMPGSIGAGGVQRVFKGMRMAGHMGNEQVTVSGLEIVAADPIKNIIYIKGAIPGARNGLVVISGDGRMNLEEIKKTRNQENNETRNQEIKKTEEMEANGKISDLNNSETKQEEKPAAAPASVKKETALE